MTDDAPSLRRQHRIGLIYALGAFTAWGVVLPIYLKALADVPVLEILAHRIVWGALFALALVAGLGRRRELSQLLVPRTMALLLVSALLVAINAATTGGLPWIALTLAFSFGFYGLVRKVVAVESLIGFSFEASILAPIAALYLLWLWASGQNSFGLATPARD